PPPSTPLLLFNATSAPRLTHPLSLHDALPILPRSSRARTSEASVYRGGGVVVWPSGVSARVSSVCPSSICGRRLSPPFSSSSLRSEEHTSELQSRFELVCRLLLEKKKIRYLGV